MTEVTKEIAQELAKATDHVREIATEIKGQMANGEKLSQSAIEKADEALLSMNEVKTRLADLEQKQARRPTDEVSTLSVGDQFIKSDAYANLIADPRQNSRAKISIKSDITSLRTDTNGAAGALVNPHLLGGIVATPQRRLTVRDLLMQGRTDSNAIVYDVETGFTNAAAALAEGDKSAQSTIKFSEVTTSVAMLSHYFKASRIILDDAAQLASHLNQRLIYGLKLVEEQQILNGDGTSGNLKGIIPQATAFDDKASLAKYSIIDQLRLAILQAALSEYQATAHILNPIDWAAIELSKDDNGRHIIGNPQGVATPTLWGLPVVVTQAMGAGKFLTGAFDMAAQIFDRQDSSISVGFENDDFTRNKVTLMADERLALAVYRPEAFVYGTLAAK